MDKNLIDNNLIIATSNAVIIYERSDDTWHKVTTSLDDHHVTSVIAREGVILAGTTQGVFRSDDLGVNWAQASNGLAQKHVRWMAYHPDISDFEFAGTEPAAIFVSRDGAATWREAHEVAKLRDTHGWHLPYSSEAGCIRDFTFNGSRVYAAAEVGGVLRSDDGGETWQLARGSSGNPSFATPPTPYIYPDVHGIAVHLSSPDRVYAPTGGGFYRSVDGGESWNLLHESYCRAVWLDAHDPDHILLGPADYVGRNGRIEETHNGGQTWHSSSVGIDMPWPKHMVERFAHIGDELFAILSNGHLLSAPIAGLEWQRILPEIESINSITTMAN